MNEEGTGAGHAALPPPEGAGLRPIVRLTQVVPGSYVLASSSTTQTVAVPALAQVRTTTLRNMLLNNNVGYFCALKSLKSRRAHLLIVRRRWSHHTTSFNYYIQAANLSFNFNHTPISLLICSSVFQRILYFSNTILVIIIFNF